MPARTLYSLSLLLCLPCHSFSFFFSIFIFLLCFPNPSSLFLPSLLTQPDWIGKGSVAVTEPALPGVVLGRRGQPSLKKRGRERGLQDLYAQCRQSSLLLLYSCCYCRPASTTFLRQQTDNPEAGESVETQPSSS